MKQLMKNLMLIILLMPLSIMAQQQKGFTISGHVDGLKDGEKVLLAHYINDNMQVAAFIDDSCIVKNGGDIYLKAISVYSSPEMYIVSFDSRGVHHRNFDNKLNKNIGGGELDILVTNGDAVKIKGGDINKMSANDFEDEITIDGSPSQYALSALKAIHPIYVQAINRINNKIKKVQDSIGYDRNFVGALIQAKQIAYWSLGFYLQDNPPPRIKPAIATVIVSIEGFLNDHPSFEMPLYNSLDERQKKSLDGKTFRLMAALAVGQPMPAFTLPDENGKMIALKDIIAKSKITLVHFWGTNSVERERYQRELRAEYKKYHDKGLNVIGVSADSVATEWKTRVIVEQYPWVNVSDLKGNLKGGIVNDLYREGGHSILNTTNVLLDDQGKIIAWDANGVVLEWYLEKYLGDKK